MQAAFKRAGFDFLGDYACPEDAAGAGLLIEDMCHELSEKGSCYIFIDDFHLLTDSRASVFLCMLARRLPGNVHLIVAGRNQFLSAADVLRLGGKVYQIGIEQLRLNHRELAVYVKRCGIKLSEGQMETLFYSSEGWFSAVYLNLQMFLERGVLPDGSSDIYAAFTEDMMKECAGRVFAALDEEKQVFYLNRFGLWYERHSQYLHAMDVYRKK